MNQSNSFYKELFLPNENLCKDNEENNSQGADAKVYILTQLPFNQWTEAQKTMMQKIIALFNTQLEQCVLKDFLNQNQINGALQNQHVDYVLFFGEIKNHSKLNMNLKPNVWNVMNGKKLFLNPPVDVFEKSAEAKSILWKGIQQEFKQ